MIDMRPLSEVDPQAATLIRADVERQNSHIHLIASENFASPAVMAASGSIFTNKYAEGYPGRRYYEGCHVVDQIETLAIDRAKALFGAEAANVQPHSGAQANMSVYFSLAQAGRPGAGDEARPGRAPHPRITGQLLGPVLRLRRLRSRPPDRTGRHGPGEGVGPGAPAPDPPGRVLRLFPTSRL